VLPKKCGHLNDKKLAAAEDMAPRSPPRARREASLLHRPHRAAASEASGRGDRARRYSMRGGAIFPRLAPARGSRNSPAACRGEVLANMTEFGRTPFFTAAEFEQMGYAMVIWPVSHLRVAAKAMEGLYDAILRDGGTQKMLDRMQTRAELYETIDYAKYETLDATLIRTIVPEGMPQG